MGSYTDYLKVSLVLINAIHLVPWHYQKIDYLLSSMLPRQPKLKEEILKQLNLQPSKIRVLFFATVAFGMGVDIHSIGQIIHIGPPRTIREYFKETGRARRDGQPAILYFNNRDIAKNKPGLQEEIRMYCRSENQCLRSLLLQSLDIKHPILLSPGHLCCSVCKNTCLCVECTLHIV